MADSLDQSSNRRIAVLLAAGEGRRLHPYTIDRPKCLVEVGGRPLLARVLAALDGAGFDELVVVTGYREDVLADFLAGFLADFAGRMRITCVRNPDYATTNNAYSLWSARVAVPEDFVLLDGDLLFERRVLTRLLASPGEVVLAVERRTDLGDEEMKVLAGPGLSVAAVNKTMDPRQAIGESVGIARFSRSAAAALWAQLEAQIVAGKRNVFYELAFEEMIAAGWGFRIADITGLQAMEIDTPEDLAAAHRLAASIDSSPV
jgi:choline kinase